VSLLEIPILRYGLPVGFRRLAVALLGDEQITKQEQSLTVSAPELLSALHRPLAFDRKVLEEVAPVEAGGRSQVKDRLLWCLVSQPSSFIEVPLVGFDVVVVGERAPEGVATLSVGDPLLSSQGSAQAEDGVVEAATESG
jgi:hypothetical protein